MTRSLASFVVVDGVGGGGDAPAVLLVAPSTTKRQQNDGDIESLDDGDDLHCFYLVRIK